LNTSSVEYEDRLPLANVLVSYPYMNRTMIEELKRWERSIRFVLDCGAFSAHHKGTTVNLDEYCAFVGNLPFRPWRYFALDVIGDPVRTMANYEAMIARGMHPIAIFTRGESREVMEHYYETADVIGTGGMTDAPGWQGFMNGMIRAAAGRRLHWLGFTNMNFLKHYRPYMCDSCAWLNGQRFAQIRLYMGHGQLTVVGRPTFARLKDEAVFARIRQYGLDPYALYQGHEWHGKDSTSQKVSAASAVALSLDIHRNLGTLLFNAVTTPHHLRQLMEAWEFQQGGRHEKGHEPRTGRTVGRTGFDHVPVLGEDALQ
jgi:hypothetical protein